MKSIVRCIAAFAMVGLIVIIWSVFSPSPAAAQTADEPVSCSVTAAESPPTLEWTPATDTSNTGYSIWRNGFLYVSGVSFSQANGFIDFNADILGRTYHYSIAGEQNGVLSEKVYCGSAVAVPWVPPAPTVCSVTPTGLDEFGFDTARIDFPSDVNLFFTMYVDGVSQSFGSGPFRFTANSPGTYSFSVSAAWAGIESDLTDCGSVDLGAPIRPPVQCNATDAAGSVVITWDSSDFDNTLYHVVRRSRDGNSPSWAARVLDPAEEWSDSNVSAGSTYSYWVERYTPSGVSTRQSCGSVVLGSDPMPVAPVSCSSFLSGDRAFISWVRADDDNAEQFVLRRTRDGGQRWWAGRVDAPTSGMSNGPLAEGSTYVFEIETVALDGSLSEPVDCGTILIGGSVSPPASCSATLNGTSATIAFTPAVPDNAVRYILRRTRDNGARWWAGRINAGSNPQFVNGGLVLGSSYEFEVEAVAADGTLSTPVNCGKVFP